MKPWKRIEPTIVTKIGYRTVVVKQFIMPDGRTVDWTIMNEDGWAAANAIVVTKDNKVVVARQFRPGPEQILDELPGGIVDPGETPEQCAVREVAEEVGYIPGTVEYLGASHYDAYVNGDRHYFLFTNCTPSEEGAHVGIDESIEIRLISIDTLLKIAKEGRMTDPGCVLMAYEKLQKLKDCM
ncbi:MAG TPA: NUDIX hydrolase [Verrucomicrobiae bacterium]|nr:NUDIX hydrolase [Verrucomicrobiae bacterium]